MTIEEGYKQALVDLEKESEELDSSGLEDKK